MVRDVIFLILVMYLFKNVNYVIFVVVYFLKILFNFLLVKCSFYEFVRCLILYIIDVVKVIGCLNLIFGFCIDI